MFNAEKYIDDTIKSILLQTYNNYEVLLINDGSLDLTESKCQKYLNDRRFRYYKHNNRGVSFTRNRGIQLATGDYIMFLDADDLLHPDCLKIMIYYAEQHHKSIISCDYFVFGDNTKIDWVNTVPKVQKIYLDEEFVHDKIRGTGVVWGKLFPRNCVENISFNEEYYVSEDTLFFLEAFIKVKTMIYIDCCYYAYRDNKDSVMHSSYNQKKHSQMNALLDASNLVKDYSRKDALFLKAQIALRAYGVLSKNSDSIENALRKELMLLFIQNYKYIGNIGILSRIRMFYKYCICKIMYGFNLL